MWPPAPEVPLPVGCGLPDAPLRPWTGDREGRPYTGEVLPLRAGAQCASLQPSAGNGRGKFSPARRHFEPHLSPRHVKRRAFHREEQYPKVTKLSAAAVIEGRPIS